MSIDIFQNNLTKYDNPSKYDALYNDYQDDLLYILEAVKNVKGPIIELACGTGRLTIPLVREGYEIYGVDIHEGMLNLAIQKATKEGLTIQFERQNCTELALPIQSAFMYMTGNSFQHFLTNASQDALFCSVKAHLTAGGTFIFDTRNPILKELAVAEEVEECYMNSFQQLVTEKSYEVYDHSKQILYCTTDGTISDGEEIVAQYSEAISLRYTYPLELQRLIEAHGFEIVALYGSWKKEEFHKDSPSMIVHCRLK
ncbi:class I SAM-dependent methyltransferase [Lysinibacillus piscis]|uniref:Methyltransferase n=1 Tax=Lysinibacillus piscis TaxID=2518931 RepID=A0ABQ5NN46_9BACI|nr:class I SAM-dependent methyltransferase [Lysinibacillus sp. KH24]GLC89538.1 methyltransferase [Lysinibacillus sp. KH24]